MIGTSRVAASVVSVDWLDLFLRLRAVFFFFVVLPALVVCVVAVVRLYGGRRLRAVRKGVAR